MFSVPGWTILAPLNQQTAPSPAIKSAGLDNTTHSKKRKRKRGKKPGNGESAEPESKDDGEVKRQKNSEVNTYSHKAHEHGHINGSSALKDSKKEARNGKTTNSHEMAGSASIREHGRSETISKKESKESRDGSSRSKSADRHNKDKSPGSTIHKSQIEPKPAAVTIALTPMQKAMREKLTGARFRHLNETMYTSKSTDNFKLFVKNPDMWEDYHAGFAQQVQSWPENPVVTFIKEAKRRLNSHNEATIPLPRTQGHTTVVDMGCGDAKFAKAFEARDLKKHQLHIRSFDLNSSVEGVEKADCAALPLTDSSIDVVIICLALMGTNWVDFIEEAYRILHWKGELWVAEIKSRFARADKKGGIVNHSVGKRQRVPDVERRKKERLSREDEAALSKEVDGAGEETDQTDVSSFVSVLESRGFVVDENVEGPGIDKHNKMFVKFKFVKAKNPYKGKYAKPDAAAPRPKGRWLPEEEEHDDNAVLKPCLYKIR